MNFIIKYINLILIMKRKFVNFSRLHVYSCTVDSNVISFKIQKSDDIVIKVCNSDDLILFGKLKEKFHNDMKDGNILVGAFKDNKVVGYNWIGLDCTYVPEIERFVYFNGAYIYRLLVYPDFRREGIAKNLLTFSINYILEEYDITNIYTLVMSNNKNSKKTFESLNFVRTNSMKFYRVLFWNKFKDNIRDDNIKTFLGNQLN